MYIYFMLLATGALRSLRFCQVLLLSCSRFGDQMFLILFPIRPVYPILELTLL